MCSSPRRTRRSWRRRSGPIADDLHSFHLQAWATTAFLIASTISTPLYGKLSDIYGRRGFFLFAIGVFIVGSMLCGLSQDMYQLTAFRAVQGIGAGGLMSLALVIVGDILPPRVRARYQGLFLAVFGTASVIGPLLGGFLAGADQILWVDGWRWVFYEHAYRDEALLPLRLFGNRTIAVGAAASTIVGMGMFGTLTTLPLYLQIVKGSSATLAGLQMIPFMAGIMTGSILWSADSPHRPVPDLPDHRLRPDDHAR